GVSPSFVVALEEETAEKAKPLPFQAALPVRPAVVAGTLALGCIAVLAVPTVHDPEWRTALRRVTLAAESYTALSATASAEAVEEGGDVEVRATLSGRARPEVVLHVREVGEPQ